MRILIYGLNYAPELTGIGKYTGEMCAWLVSRGHEVRAVTAPPYYPEWRVLKGYSSIFYRTEEIEGVRVTRCPLWVPTRPTGAKRILHLLSFAASSLPAALVQGFSWRPDIVLTVEPAFFCAPGALLLARLSGAKVWLHVQDFEMDAAFDMGIVKSGLAKRAAMAFERWVTRRFDRVSTISERMLEKLSSKGVERSNSVLFPNWVDTGRIYPLGRRSALRDEFKISDGNVVILYSGNMGEKQGLDIILEAARELKAKKDILFILCGDGVARERLEASSKGAGNIRFMSLQPVERLNELLNAADIHLLPQRADVADLVMPSKLLGMYSSGRPVVATARAGTQVAEVVRKCGVVVEPGNAAALAGALSSLAENPERREKLGQAAREFALVNWGIDEVLGRAVRAMEDCVGKRMPEVAKASDYK